MPTAHHIAPRPIEPVPPLIFVLVWNGFVSAHAWFMLSGALNGDIGVLLFLLLLYAVFFGAGIWMLRAWLRWRQLKHRFGVPQEVPTSSIHTGEPFKLSLRFDRPWPPGEAITGALVWVGLDTDGDTMYKSAPKPVAGAVHAAMDETMWHANIDPSAPPPDMPDHLKPMLELHLRAEQGKGPGWRIVLPAEAVETENAATLTRQFTPEQQDKTRKVLTWITAALLVAAAGFMAYALSDTPVSAFRLTFPLGFCLVAYLVWGMRQTIGELSDTPIDIAQYASPPGKAVLMARFKRWSGLFVMLMFGAIAMDIFLPDVPDRAIAMIAGNVDGTSDGLQRPDHPVEFTLPERMFNGQSMAMDVITSGKGVLHGDKLKLHFDKLSMREMLSRPDTERLHANKIVIDATEDAGKYVRSVGRSHDIPLSSPDADRAYVLTDLDVEIPLAPRANLGKIWLRLELWSGNGYTPIDASPGHLMTLMAQADPRFDTCKSDSMWGMSPRKAIEQKCSAQLEVALGSSSWRLVEWIHMLKGDDPLVLHAYHEGNVEAIGVLHRAGAQIDALDSRKRTALMIAAWNNRADFVQALLAAGADPNYRPTPQSHSALSGALYDGYTETAKLMLKDTRVLDEQAKSFGYHPAHLVIMNGHMDTVRLLLDAGLDVNTVNTGSDGRGETLLMAAARTKKNSLATIDLLLSRGARLDALDRFGKNATDWANFFGNQEAGAFLVARGLPPTK